MKSSGKVVLLSFGAFGLTVALAVMTVIATLIIARPQSCSDYSQALLLLWVVIGGLCLASTAVVGIGTWRIAHSKRGSVITTAVYGLIILFTYLFIALILMIGFNC
jgi:hypothetical protein